MFDLFKNAFKKRKETRRAREVSTLEKARIERARVQHSQRYNRTSTSSSTDSVTPLVLTDSYSDSSSPCSSDYGCSPNSFSSCD